MIGESCPKCGCNVAEWIIVRYRPDKLHCMCKRCGYTWTEEPIVREGPGT